MFVPVNWDAFKAKFGGTVENTFEYLSYLIFCRKFGRQFGIAGYRNHPGIEKKSICIDGKFIGFQSKFFQGKFSAEKGKILDAVCAAKQEHPELSVLMFFMPMDHDFSPKRKGNNRETKAQIEVEKAATKIGLTLEWFCHSEFLATMADESYSYWAAHFFNQGEDIFTFIKSLEDTTNRILDVVHNSISASGYNISIQRTTEIMRINDFEAGSIVVISGESGVGKTALVKSLVEQIEGGCIYVLRPNEVLSCFDSTALAATWHIRMADFMDVHSDYKHKILVVDDVWKIFCDDNHSAALVNNHIDELASILSPFVHGGWKLIVTTWSIYKPSVDTLLRTKLEKTAFWIDLDVLSMEKLNEIATNNDFVLPTDSLTCDLLRIPFYLNEFLSLPAENRGRGLKRFKEVLWREKIQCNNPLDTASNTFIYLISKKTQSESCWLDICGVDRSDLEKLAARGILAKDVAEEAFFTTHDIYEEWARERIIERLYDSKDTDSFFSELKDSRSNRRAYRQWLEDKLGDNELGVEGLIDSAIADEKNLWREETVLAVLSSPISINFLNRHKGFLFAEGGRLLTQIVDWVRLSCRVERSNPASAVLGKCYGFDEALLRYSSTSPVGKEWRSIICFLYENREEVLRFKQDEILYLLHDWCSANQEGDVTRYAAKMAFEIALRNMETDWNTHLFSHDSDNVLLLTLSNGAREIKTDLEAFINQYLEESHTDVRGFPEDYCHAIVAHSLEHVNFIRTNPELTRRILSDQLFRRPIWDHYDSLNRAEECMGITTRFRHDCASLSAFQTPIYWLLREDFWPTLKYLLELTNYLIEKWAKSNSNVKKTSFAIGNGTESIQYISHVLWCANRGVGLPKIPNIIASMHMAFEKILLDLDSCVKDDDAEYVKRIIGICLYVIQHSRSASLTGAINSLVLKNPNRYYSLGVTILSSPTAIECDMWRAQFGESYCNQEYAWMPRRDFVYQGERAETLKQDFRTQSLQDIMLHYQCSQGENSDARKMGVQKILDMFEQSDDPDVRDLVCKLDLRKMRPITLTGKNGEPVEAWEMQIPKGNNNVSEAERQELTINALVASLTVWAESKILQVQITDCAQVYENDTAKLLADAKQIVDKFPCKSYDDLIADGVPRVAAALLRFHHEILSEELYKKCANIVLDTVEGILHAGYSGMMINCCPCTPSSLPVLCCDSDPIIAKRSWRLAAISMLCEIDYGPARICDYVFNTVRDIGVHNNNLVRHFIGVYQKVRCAYGSFASCPNAKISAYQQNKDLLQLFFEVHSDVMVDIDKPQSFDVDSILSVDDAAKILQNVLLMIPDHMAITDNDCKKLVIDGSEIVLNDIYRIDEDGRLNSNYLGVGCSVYQRRLSELMMVLADGDVLQIIEKLRHVPLAFSDKWLLLDIVRAANSLGMRERFWRVWRGLMPVMKELVDGIRGKYFHLDVGQALEKYFLGRSLWGERPEDCKLFSRSDMVFWEECMVEFGVSMTTIYALQSFLGSLGLAFWREGIMLLAKQIEALQDTYCSGFEEEYFIGDCERYMSKVVSENQSELKRRPVLNKAVQTIIDFLVKKKSKVGYALRNAIS